MHLGLVGDAATAAGRTSTPATGKTKKPTSPRQPKAEEGAWQADLKLLEGAQKTKKNFQPLASTKNMPARLPVVIAGRTKDARPLKSNTSVTRTSARTIESALSVTTGTESPAGTETIGAHLNVGADGVAGLHSDVVPEKGTETGTDNSQEIRAAEGTRATMTLITLKENSLLKSI